MVTTSKTRTKRNRSRSQKFKKAVLGRPQGIIQKRVQAVGPERFGVVAIDCAKAQSTWRLTDFYGNVLTQSANVEHNRSSFQLAVLTLKQAVEKHGIKDLIVAVVMTGTYHKPIASANRPTSLTKSGSDRTTVAFKNASFCIDAGKCSAVGILASLTNTGIILFP